MLICNSAVGVSVAVSRGAGHKVVVVAVVVVAMVVARGAGHKVRGC